MPSNGQAQPLPALGQTKLHIGHSFVWTHIFPESSQVPSTRAKHATCLHNGAIYMYGGVCGTMSLKDMWRFVPDTSIWAKLECRGEAPPLLQAHTMVGYKESIYIFGGICGFDDPGETSLWILDLTKFVWTKQVIESEVTTPASRRGHSVVVHQGGMHIFGGHVDLKGSCNELWTLDFETLYWHTWVFSNQDPAPPPRHGHSAVIHDNCLYIYGGTNNLLPLKDMWKWHFGCRQWSKVRFWQGPPPLHGHTAITLGDSMMVYGGQDSSGNCRSDLWVFSYSSENWTKVPYRGSIIPSPTIHHTLELNIPDYHALLPCPDERSLSAPFLQRPSLSSLDVKPPRRPHSSPPYSAETREKSPPHRSRVFRNKVHPGDDDLDASPVDDGSYSDSQMMLNGFDDGDENECKGNGDDDEDIYNSRIFIPVLESMNASRERLLGSTSDLDSNFSANKFFKGKIKPENAPDDNRNRVMNGDSAPVSNFVQSPSAGEESIDQNERFSRHRVEGLPQVKIEDYDRRGITERSSLNERDNGNIQSTDWCNTGNHGKFSEPPRLVNVLPRSISDKIPLILSGALDDLHMNEVAKSQENYAFINAGFNLADDSSNARCRLRSNSLTSLDKNLNLANTSDERHQSLNDLPNMATLIMQRQESQRENEVHRYKKETYKSSRPKLRKRSQTDQALYAKTVQYNTAEFDNEVTGSGKGRYHLPVPVHLYVLGGQEPNVSSLHRYQSRLSVFRCTIVPGKPTASQIQVLLH